MESDTVKKVNHKWKSCERKLRRKSKKRKGRKTQIRNRSKWVCIDLSMFIVETVSTTKAQYLREIHDNDRLFAFKIDLWYILDTDDEIDIGP